MKYTFYSKEFSRKFVLSIERLLRSFQFYRTQNTFNLSRKAHIKKVHWTRISFRLLFLSFFLSSLLLIIIYSYCERTIETLVPLVNRRDRPVISCMFLSLILSRFSLFLIIRKIMKSFQTKEQIILPVSNASSFRMSATGWPKSRSRSKTYVREALLETQWRTLVILSRKHAGETHSCHRYRTHYMVRGLDTIDVTFHHVDHKKSILFALCLEKEL